MHRTSFKHKPNENNSLLIQYIIMLLNKPLKILLITDAFVLISSAMIVPFYTVFVQKIGGNILEAGLAASVFAIAAGTAALLSGSVSDKIKRKEWIIGGCYLVIALGFLLYIRRLNLVFTDSASTHRTGACKFRARLRRSIFGSYR